MRWGDSLRTQGQASTGRITIEDVYQAFKKRLIEEINERAAKDGYAFLMGGKAKCEHEERGTVGTTFRVVRYKDIGDDYCRDCGERL